MKLNIKDLTVATLLCTTALLAGCREEHMIEQGEGRLALSTSVMDEIKVVSRALSDEQHNALCSSALIWISNSQRQLLYKYNGLASFPADGLPLASGSYLAEVWAGDSIPASWEGIRYHGKQPFDIATGTVTPVNVTCTVRNTLVEVNPSAGVLDALCDLSMTVGLNDGLPLGGEHSLEYSGDNLAATGYYMVNSRTAGLAWSLRGTDIKGNPFERKGVYEDPDAPQGVARATKYIFNIKYDVQGGDIEIGGAYLDIDVVPEPVEGTVESVIIALAPEITGLDGLDLGRTLLREPGGVGRLSLHVIGSSPLASVVIEGDMLKRVAGYSDYDLLAMDDTHRNALKGAGINFITVDNRPEADKATGTAAATNLRLNLEESFTSGLEAGDYTLTLRATDTQGKTSQRSLQLNVSEVPGVLVELGGDSDILYTQATLQATVTKPGTRMGFEVKATGTAGRAWEDWNFVPGTLDGTALTAVATGLHDGTTYACRLVIDNYTSAQTVTFTTRSYPQLPNAGFEDWTTAQAPYLIYSGGESNMFWDSGNHGSSTMSKNVTVPDESVKHSGRYSIKLASQFVGVGVIGKFAAGNVFIGKYLKTDGTDGVLGWGRPWGNFRPKALRGWVKYAPVAVTHDNSKYTALKKGDMDKGIVYMALLDDTTVEYSGEHWPVVIKTKTSELFDKNGANVIAYGEKVFDSATGEGMVQFEIPLDYKSDRPVVNIMLVASASIGGDYFVGGNGSNMWLDDLELVY